MLAAFFLSIGENVSLLWRLAGSLGRGGILGLPRRLVIFSTVWLATVFLCSLHWLGFLLDEIFFRAYRKIQVKNPTFIIGVPRSGTTWLQRVMAEDSGLTTLTLWECLFAPSITERYAWRVLAKVFKPLSSVALRAFGKASAEMDKIHKIRLNDAEEDFLLLLPVQACFLMVLLCPNSAHYWRLAKFDQEISEFKRKVIIRYYYSCIQKHLFVHGKNKRLLSKNPSYTPFIRSLSELFEGARFIACVRPPEKTVASQLSSLMPVLKLLGETQMDTQFRNAMIELLHSYYDYLSRNQLASRILVVEMAAITQHLSETIEKIYAYLDLDISDDFRERLSKLETNGKKYKSGHRYELETFELAHTYIAEKFANVWPLPDAA